MIIVRRINIVLVAIFTALSSKLINSASTNQCNQYCGSGRANRTQVPYPFGFSTGCPIRLDCHADGVVRIGDFRVQNITSDYVLIVLPANCNRSIHEIKQQIHSNFALTLRNNLLLQNCSSPLSGCMIPTSLMDSRFQLEGCKSRINESISCFSQDYSGIDFMDYDNVTRTNCTVLFSSIAVDFNNSTNRNSAVSLEFQILELGWWLNGTCSCVDDANCTNVTLADGELGYRCRCKEGFEGDGFTGGRGCRKAPVSNCNASKYISGRCGGTARLRILIGGAIAGSIIMAAIVLICFCIRRKSTSLRNQMSAKRLLSEAGGGCSTIPFFPYKEIERATNGFSEKQRLGTGAYGTVYAGKLHGDDLVAIKKIRHKDAEGIEQVMNEIKLLSSVSHPNLVRLLGCCIENDEQILVYEYMPNGTLSQHLQSERSNNKGLPWTIRLTIATETAHAISHLHTMNPPIYHRDIKSSNILLDYNYNSKVADFGLSRLGMTDDSHISTAPQGTPGYLDPQYHQNFHLSDKSDVYSFGVVLVEIITAQKVVDFSRPHSEINLAALAVDRIGKGRVDEIIDPFLDPHKDAWTLSSLHKVAELAFRCLAFHRDMRPTMMEVAEELEQIRLSGWAPMEDNMSISSSVGSACSSPHYSRSEKSFGGTSVKKIGMESRRLIVPHRVDNYLATTREEMKDSSPVSVQDPWLSEQSSPSTNSLLGNVAR